MKSAIALISLILGSALALPKGSQQRIVGGDYTTIDKYPQSAAVLSTTNFVTYGANCGGTIINNVAILTAAHCHVDNNPLRFRVRVGSSFVSSGGVVYQVQQVIDHPNYNSFNFDNDISVIRLSSPITFTNLIQPGAIAGVNYNVADNQAVWAIGWGLTEFGFWAEQLKEVQIWTINQEICRQRYSASAITDNMMCSGVLDVGGRDACTGDSGGPLLHNNVVVGVCSFGSGCGDPFYPGVHARVSRYTNWILANAQ